MGSARALEGALSPQSDIATFDTTSDGMDADLWGDAALALADAERWPEGLAAEPGLRRDLGSHLRTQVRPTLQRFVIHAFVSALGCERDARQALMAPLHETARSLRLFAQLLGARSRCRPRRRASA